MTVNKIKKILKQNKLTFVNVEKVLNKIGYSVVFFDTPDGDKEIERYELAKEAKKLKSFTYAKTAHIVFINDVLHSDDKLYLALHELGHIILGHVGDGKLTTRNSILVDIEADNFAYSIIYPPKRNLYYVLAATIVLLIFTLFGASYVYNPNKPVQNEPVQVQAISTQNSAQSDTSQSEPPISDAVYVTSSGKKFHRADCMYVKNKNNVTHLERDTATRLYEPCSVCNP